MDYDKDMEKEPPKWIAHCPKHGILNMTKDIVEDHRATGCEEKVIALTKDEYLKKLGEYLSFVKKN